MKKGKTRVTEKLRLFLAVLLTFAMLLNGPYGAMSVMAEDEEVVEQIDANVPSDGEGAGGGISLLATTTPSAITVKNYIGGIPDKVIVADLKAGDAVKVYDSETDGKLIGVGTVDAGQDSVTIEIAQLDKEGGTIYVSVTSLGMGESERVAKNYVSEPIPWQIYDHTGNWGEDHYLKDNKYGNRKTNVFTVPTTVDGEGKLDRPAGFPAYPPSMGDNHKTVNKYNKHIIVKKAGETVTFYGYGAPSFKDFVFLPNSSSATKEFKFELDFSTVSFHTLEGAGILFNSEITPDEKITGYALLITGVASSSNGNEDTSKRLIKLFRLTNVDVNQLNNSLGTNKIYKGSTMTGIAGVSEEEITVVDNNTTLNSSNVHEFEVIITNTETESKITLKDTVKGATKTLIDNQKLGVKASGSSYGIGLIASYSDHNCSVLSYLSFKNVRIGEIQESEQPLVEFPWPILDLTAIPGDNQATVTYTAPTDAEIVVLQQSEDGQNFTNIYPSDVKDGEATVTNLDGGKKYYYRLLVGGGKNAGISNVATVTPTMSTNKTATITLKKNNSPWTGSDKVVALYQGGSQKHNLTQGEGKNGVYTAQVPNGDYDIYVDGIDTGAKIMVNDSNVSQDIDFCTVIFDKNTGNAATDKSEIAVVKGKEVTPWQIPTRPGYTFVGWHDNPAGTGTEFDSNTKITDLITLYAQWNSNPTASNVAIEGSGKIGDTLTGKYEYADADQDSEKKGEGGTTYKWYRGKDKDGSDKTPIPGAAEATYTVTGADEGYYLFFEVTPVDTKDASGSPALSGDGYGPVLKNMNLKGEVTDQKTGKAIEGADVILTDLSGNEYAKVKTDKDGNYLFSKVPVGKYKVTVKNPKYSDKTMDVDLVPVSNSGIVTKVGEGNFTLTKDVELVDFIITLVANPSSIVGDGKTTTTLRAQITDKDNKPIQGIEVDFSTLGGGSFPDGSKATTDSEGKCSVEYKSQNLSGIDSKVVVVKAKVKDDVKKLYAESEILVTFEPSSIQGIVRDNATNNPVAGAVIEVSKDFDGDGIADFYAKMVTGTDGRYKIAVPKGGTKYNVNITKPVEVNGTLKPVTFNQTCDVGNISGVGLEDFDAMKTITGVVLAKASDGKLLELADYSKYEMELVDSHGSIKNEGVSSGGIFKAEGLTKGESYTINLKYDFGDSQKITVGKAVATVNADGEIVISIMLIDPYGTVTDRVTNQPISGVNMKLYWADTDLNKSKGRTPGTLVPLPAENTFATNDNKNPQSTDGAGFYAWMVFPDGDYYIIAEKSGYYTFDSRYDKRDETVGTTSWIKNGIIHVGADIVLYHLQMEPRDRDRDDGGGGSSAPIISAPPLSPPTEKQTNIVNPQSPVLVVPADELTKKDILTGALNRYNEQEKTKAQRENRTPQLIDVSNLNASTYEFSSSNSSIADFDTTGILNIYGRGPFVIRISEKGTNNVYEYQMVASQRLQRIAGATRIDTALAIAKGSYFGKVKSVVVARADDFPDALTGSVLAYKKEAPVLLVGRSEEDCRKLVEYLKGYLEPQGTVYILGGTGAVSQYVEDSVKNNGFSNVIRLGGADRYGTAAKIAVELDIAQGRPVVIASGQSFPDALSVSSIAAAEQFPLLIVKPNSVPDEVNEKLIQLKPSMVYIIGYRGR